MKTVLTIAGSDSSGGAGIQADIKTFEHFDTFSTTALTALTAQNTKGVEAIHSVDASFVIKQIESVWSDFFIDAVKIGMLGSKETAEAIYGFFSSKKVTIVFDPVAVSKAGSVLLPEEAVESLKPLFTLSDVITPNMYEANLFFGVQRETPVEEIIQILQKEKISAYTVFKKFHITDSKVSDLIIHPDGNFSLISSGVSHTNALHGSGCSFSSAITALVANGYEAREAIAIAKKYVENAMNASSLLGEGVHPLKHKLKESV